MYMARLKTNWLKSSVRKLPCADEVMSIQLAIHHQRSSGRASLPLSTSGRIRQYCGQDA